MDARANRGKQNRAGGRRFAPLSLAVEAGFTLTSLRVPAWSSDHVFMPAEPPSPTATLQSWLVRIPEVFAPVAPEILRGLGAVHTTTLGTEYFSIKTPLAGPLREVPAALFTRWHIPLHHAWPCHPAKMEHFVEKAAQTLWTKFGPKSPQQVLIGPLNPNSPDPYYKSLASNLRGRALQLFPKFSVTGVEDQNPEASTLYALVGREGLFCGLATPREANGFHSGGSYYVAKDTPQTISRAGGKIAEALHYLRLYRAPLPPGSRWLELGASPGGMTSELLARGYHVTALDRSPLDRRLFQHPQLEFHQTDVAQYRPATGARFDALLNDMNGDPEDSLRELLRLATHLKPGGIAIFTLKLPKVVDVPAPLGLRDEMVRLASRRGLTLFAQTHLTANRHEFTLFFEKPAA